MFLILVEVHEENALLILSGIQYVHLHWKICQPQAVRWQELVIKLYSTEKDQLRWLKCY